MWNVVTTVQEHRNALKYIIQKNGDTIRFFKVLELWQNDISFRNFFIDLLQNAPYQGYFWETPPVTQDELDRPFEFVLVDSSILPSINANRQAFSEHFEKTDLFKDVVSFSNLGGDARLVVPCPVEKRLDYPHLAAFMNHAPNEQLHEFWKCVGYYMERHVSKKHTWLSTAGLGVYWLHIRLDSRPKYYRFTPYKADFWK